MEPTLPGRLWFPADMNAYRRAKPARWQAVVLRLQEPNTVWVFRVIGLPGETVSFSEGKVVIDGQPMVPPTYLPNQNGGAMRTLPAIRYHCDVPNVELVPHPYTVPDGCYYLLGDNPDEAHDSRLLGAFPEAEILGRVDGR